MYQKEKTKIPTMGINTLPFHKKVTNFEHPRPDPVRDQFVERVYSSAHFDHTTKVQF